MAIEAVGNVYQFTDENGVPYAGGSLTFVIVSTSTAQAVYSDPALTVSLGNIVTLNAAGRTSTSSTGPDTPIYFQQKTYDYTLKNASGTVIFGPITFSGSQWPGQVQGQAILSPAINANGYTNRFTTTINKAISGIHALFAGTRFDTPTIGSGASTLTEATTVYIEGAPATGTNRYAFHVASGASLFDGDVTITGTFTNLDNGVCDFRLTLTTGVPVTTADVLAATVLFSAPYKGNRITLFDSLGSASVFTSAQFSIAVPATTNTVYDVFCFNSANVPTLELLAWTNDTTRATAIVNTTTGVYTKSGDLTRRYLGSFRTTGVSGQTEDSALKRYVWNYYNRIDRPLFRVESTATWNYTTATVRQANGATANQVEVVQGVAESPIELCLTASVHNANNTVVQVGIGEDSTTTISALSVGGGSVTTTGSAFPSNSLVARFVKVPAVGRHVYAWLEYSAAGGTSSWYGSPASDTGLTGTANGITGSILG